MVASQLCEMMLVEDSSPLGHIDTKFVYDGLHYIVSYYFSNLDWSESTGTHVYCQSDAFSCSRSVDHDYWPSYMREMDDSSESVLSRLSTVFEQFHISEFIYIHLV